MSTKSDDSVIKVEFGIQIKCNSCKDIISDELSKLNDVKIVDIDVEQQRLLVELSRNSSSAHEIQQTIESKLGLNTIIKGLGDSIAAVSEITGPEEVIGVVRFTQLLNKLCLVDGVIDGIKGQNKYSLNIHEFGDLSGEGYQHLGPVILRVLPELSSSEVSAPEWRSTFKTQISNCNLSSCIGRSLAVSLHDRVIGAGIVARASSVGDNSKRICACSGRSLWEERSITGPEDVKHVNNCQRVSFSDRICDDLCQFIVKYLSVEERYKLQLVSKQFQRTIFAAKICLVIKLEDDLEKRQFIKRFRQILKDFSNIEIIRIRGDITDVNKQKVKNVFDAIHDFCNNSTKFILRVDLLFEETFQRFLTKFGKNIIELQINKPILSHKVFASIKESNVEKLVLKNGFDSSLNEIQFKRLKYLKLKRFNTKDFHPLEVFIKRNNNTIKHLDIHLDVPSNQEKAKILNIISKSSNLVELKLKNELNFNNKSIAKQWTQISNNCQKLKSIEICFRINPKNSKDINQVMEPFRQFKELRRLKLEFIGTVSIKAFIEMFSFKIFKGFENITHLSIEFYCISHSIVFSETILTDIDINLPKLQYFKIGNELVVTEWTVDILSRLSRLKNIDLQIPGELNVNSSLNSLKIVNEFKYLFE